MPHSPSQVAEPAARPGLVAVDGRAFPLAGAELRARAGGGLAATTLVQRYRNPYAEPLEVLYTLPLPADGAVTGYTIRAGERVIRGEVERRETAQRKYREALIEGRLAGLLEQERADTFTQSLGSLPPGRDVTVEIDVLQPLLFLSGGDAGARPAWEYRFPTVAGVRYEGAPGRVPDADRLDVDRADGSGTPVRVSGTLVVLDGTPETIAPRSTSHALAVDARDGATAVALAEARLDRDVAVRWSAVHDAVGAVLREGPGLAGDDGRYALLTLTPPAAPAAVTARDLTLLIDASGSMSGAPLETVKRVAGALLRSLAPHDRLEILAFASNVQKLTDGVIPATESNVHRALSALTELRAGGATEMVGAIKAALVPLRADAQRQVILFTDGFVGFESEVVGEILRALPAGARLHTVGIGSAPNRTLTRGGARAGRGVELIVGNLDDADAAGQNLCRATVAPVLTDITVRGRAVRAIAPERPRDVLRGAPLLVALELQPQGGTVEVVGRLAGRGEPWKVRLDVAGAAEGGAAATADALPAGALFGREAIEDCEMRLAASRDVETMLITRRIEELGLRHRIPSRRTSLVAIAEEPSVDPTAPRQRERLAVEMPADVSATGVAYFGSNVMRCATLEADEALPRAMRMSAPRSAPGWLGKVKKLLGADEPSTWRLEDEIVPGDLQGRFVTADRDSLVLEFEAPEDGFVVPSGPVAILLAGHTVASGTIDATKSTRAGTIARGLTVRLAINVSAGRKLWSEWSRRLATEYPPRLLPSVVFRTPRRRFVIDLDR